MTQISDGYSALLTELKQRIRSARLRTVMSVNSELILLYWSIGRDLRARKCTEGWGAKVITRLAADLRRAFPDMTGISARNLEYMQSFTDAWPDQAILQQVAAKLPWGHNTLLLQSVKSAPEREWYARQAIQNGWSRSVLTHQIESRLFARQGRALTNFTRTLPAAQSDLAQQLFKDPYSFEFLCLGADMLERDLQRGLLDHVRSLLLELGKGFAFVGSQFPIGVGDQDYFIDLLFYHLRLRCFVVIELKVEGFKPEFTGKMNFYLSAVDDHLRHPDDQPSIGIILCKSRNEVVVEYALRDSSKPMGVAQYRVSAALPERLKRDLPTVEDLEPEFQSLAVFELQREVEYSLRDLAAAHDILAARPRAIDSLLHELKHRGKAPPSTDRFLEAWPVIEAAVDTFDLDSSATADAMRISQQILFEMTCSYQHVHT
ncbi:MAG TPA: PDDEXK nuclease domain-containing protein [Steroidobacter sp.]